MGNEENKAQQEVDGAQAIPLISDFDSVNQEEKSPTQPDDQEGQSGLIPRDDNAPCEESSGEPSSQEMQAAEPVDGTKTEEIATDDITRPIIEEAAEAPDAIKSEEPASLTEPVETAIAEHVSVEAQETIVGDIPSAELAEVLARYNEEFEQEIQEFSKSKARFDECLEFELGFRSEIETISPKAFEIVELCNVLNNINLPEPLADTVKNSKAGVDLVLKMISRLADRIPKIDASKNPQEKDLAKPGSELIPVDMSEIKSYFDDLSTRNYGRVTAMRRAADDSRQALFSFIKTHFLAIVDGITDGRRHFEQQKAELLIEHPDYGGEIERWFGVYDKLLGLFDDIFEQFQMEPIKPAVGEKANYELHEPFDTAVTSDYPDESVHEIIRPGYKYAGPLYGESGHVIRPALIVVTKTS
jgi:molecular chaperone GrpE (heat shock protein)